MYSLSSSPSNMYMFIELVNLSYNTLKDAFEHHGGICGDLLNQRRETSSRDIIQLLKSGP